MSEIQLVRQDGAILESDREAARRVLFGLIDGLGEQGRKAWRRFFNGLMRLEPGEIVEVEVKQERSGPFHRRHMAMEQRVFEAQERFEHFEQFRNWAKVGSGFCDWVVGPKGGIIPVPRSIRYARLEEHEMRQFHDDWVAFMRSPHAIKALWPKADQAQAAEGMELLLSEFGE